MTTFNFYPTKKCEDCGGLGRIDDYPCPSGCDGTGKVAAETFTDANADWVPEGAEDCGWAYPGHYDTPAYNRKLNAFDRPSQRPEARNGGGE